MICNVPVCLELPFKLCLKIKHCKSFVLTCSFLSPHRIGSTNGGVLLSLVAREFSDYVIPGDLENIHFVLFLLISHI